MQGSIPEVSIIMATYNCEDTIDDSIKSILEQTYDNWEFIICDDCSTDNTYEILMRYAEKYPKKFYIIKNEVNSKLSYSLNRCLGYARGKYIARMDGDDISLPNRLEKQIMYLKRNEEIHIVGTGMRRFNNHGMADILYPIEQPDKYTLRNNTPFFHATIMTYKYVYDALGGYTVSKRTVRSQDRDLWFRFYYADFKGANIIEPLYLVREDLNAIKRRTFRVRWNSYITTLIGYKLLSYPLIWYIKPTLSTLIRIITPYKLLLFYRKYQKNKKQ